MTEAHNLVLLGLLAESNKYGEMTPRLIDVLLLIADVAIKDKFPDYEEYHDEMRGEAMLYFCKAWYRFNAERSQKPFEFFYLGAYSSGLQVLSRERRERIVRETLPITTTTEDEETT